MSEGDLFDSLPETPPQTAEKPAETPDIAAAAPADAEQLPPAAETPAQAELAEGEMEQIPDFEPEPEPEPEKVPVRPKVTLPRGTEGLGATLVALRDKSGLDLEEVAKRTCIKMHYLEALEKDDFDGMPQTVYVLAYVKKLCGLYGLGREETDELVAELREHLAYEIPEDIDKSVICRERDEDTRRKVRNITAAAIVLIVLLLALLILGGAVLVLRLRRNDSGVSEPPAIPASDENRPLSLLEKTELKLTRIPD